MIAWLRPRWAYVAGALVGLVALILVGLGLRRRPGGPADRLDDLRDDLREEEEETAAELEGLDDAITVSLDDLEEVSDEPPGDRTAEEVSRALGDLGL